MTVTAPSAARAVSRTLAAILIIVMLGIGLVVGAVVGYYALAPSTSSAGSLKGDVLIGDLLPLTGDLASYGANSKVATEFARDDVNAYLSASGAAWNIKLVEEDTGTSPATALQMVQTLNSQGVKLAVGPQSTGEVRQIKDTLNSNHIVIISQSSTGTDMGIANDYVFRFAPNDTVQGKALGRAMTGSGATVSVQMYRNDAWGVGLSGTSAAGFTANGGTVWSTKIAYDPTSGATGTAVATNMASLESAVGAALASVGNNATKVAVQLLSFDEGVAFLHEAGSNPSAYPNLNKVNLKWFGSDGTTQSTKLTTDTVAAAFAQKTYFLNTLFGTATSSKFTDLHQRLSAKLGHDPESYAYNAYDAVWVFALALQSVGKYDSVAVQKILNTSYLTTATAPYFGASGPIRLNSAGDRIFSDYDLWIVQGSGSAYTWVNVKHYNYLTDTVVNV